MSIRNEILLNMSKQYKKNGNPYGCLIAGYLHLSFLSLHFTRLFHSQSFKKSSPTLLQVLQPLS